MKFALFVIAFVSFALAVMLAFGVLDKFIKPRFDRDYVAIGVLSGALMVLAGSTATIAVTLL